MFPRYIEAVREGTEPGELREAVTGVLSETDAYLSELCVSRETHAVEDRAALLVRQSLLTWCEERLAAPCEALR